jgi:hypothetical protein
MAKIIRRDWTHTGPQGTQHTKGGFSGHALQTRQGVLGHHRSQGQGHKARVFPRSAVAQVCGMVIILQTARRGDSLRDMKSRLGSHKDPRLCCTEQSDGLSLLFFNVLHAVIPAWRARLPRSTVRPVSMALPDVQEAILSAETIPRWTAVPSAARGIDLPCPGGGWGIS